MLISVVLASTAFSQTFSGEREEVWSVVTQAWQGYKNEDLEEVHKHSHPNLLTWSTALQMPRDLEAVRRWDQYNFETSTNLVQELTPTGIVVQGTTAIVHYYFTIARMTDQSEHETVNGRCSDVLIKEGGRWRFLGWSCHEKTVADD